MTVREPAALVERSGWQEPVEEPWTAGPGLAASLWRYRYLVVLALLLGIALGYFGSLQQPTRYQAGGQLVMEGLGPARLTDELAGEGDPERRLRNQVERLDAWRVRERASERLDGALSASAIDEALTVSGEAEVDVITLTAVATTPDLAAGIVNAVAEAYLELAAEDAVEQAASRRAELEAAVRQLEDRIEELSAQLDAAPGDETLTVLRAAALRDLIDLSSRAQRLALTEELRPTGVRSFQRALPPRQPTQPRPRVAGALGGLVGLALAGAFAWWRAGLGDRVRTPEDAGRLLGTPVLGSVPAFRGGVDRLPTSWWSPRTSAEPYRFLAVAIDESVERLGLRTVAVTSAVSGEGKTIVAVNAALSARSQDRHITLVDADPSGRGLTAMYSLERRDGLREIVRGDADVGSCRRLIETMGGSRVSVIPVGLRTSGPMAGPGLERALHEVEESADLTIVDCGAVLSLAETVTVTGHADAILLVVRHGTRIADLERLRERLAFSETPVLGLVYNADPAARAVRRGRSEHGRAAVARPRGI